MPKTVTVYLGYEDELIDERSTRANHTIDKIGGLPDWPPLDNVQFSTKCPICSLHRPLIVQCCAPIPNSPYARTLYVFACINPNCWNQSESWTCVRSQIEEKHLNLPPSTVEVTPAPASNLSWCQGSDEWDENDNENNFMNVADNAGPNNMAQRISDEEDESNSFDVESMQQSFENLQVFDTTNANNIPAQGAVGIPVAVAEIEGKDDSDFVTVDTPTVPTNNIEALLQQTAELPPDIRSRLINSQLQFVPKYIYLEIETKKQICNDEKVIELLNKYRRENDMDVSNEAAASGIGSGDGDEELYEDAVPLHGDRLFHAFIERLRRNPGQILRLSEKYSRDVPPLLGAPITSTDNVPANCRRCGSKIICELQLLPTFADTLHLAPGNFCLPYLHFLSVLIFTCQQGCWLPSDKLVNESVVFQAEI